ncbi:MAG: glycosyltransferase family 2 protein [Candidatus Melainabacteria bacterium]|nr:glycosyltransferase family 2 protein [Candidatus Melainabacteria bacterium]
MTVLQNKKQKKALSVIVCTRNRAKQLTTLLQCLGTQRDLEDLTWEIVIVDNNSEDNTKEVAYAFCEGSNLKVNYVLESKLGSSYARNSGILASKGTFLLFLDDDVLIPNDFISNALMGIQEFEEFDIFGFRILPDWHEVIKQPFWLTFGKPFNLIQSFLPVHDLGVEPLRYPNRITKNPISASFLAKKEVFEKTGPFREDLGVNKSGQCEDTEFFWYAMINRYKILYWPYATLYHTVNPDRLSVKYLHKWYFNLGKSLYLVKNTGRIFNLRKKPLVGIEGYVANKMPKIFRKVLLDIKIFNVSLFLWIKFICLILLLPLSILLVFINRSFFITTNIAKTLGEVKESLRNGSRASTTK